MQQPTRRKRLLKRIVRITLKSFLFIFIFLVLVVLLVLTPPVQNFLRKKAVTYLEKKLQTKVAVGKIYIGLPKKVVIEDVYMEDRQKDTLLTAGSLKMDINILKLIFNGELDINKTELRNSTVKINRQLPDTVFNFQFIVDAFAPASTNVTAPDTSASPLALGIVQLDKVRVTYHDVITGSDMETWIDHLDTKIDNFDPQHFRFDVPETNINGATARIYQVKPLARPEPEAKDMAEAKQASPLQLAFKTINLKNFKLDYRNDVSATYATVDLGALNVKPTTIDMTNRVVDLDNVSLENSIITFHLGKKETARVVAKQAKQEVKSRANAGWYIKATSFNLEQNSLQFDNDNSPPTRNGIDYNHLKVADLTLEINDLVLNEDSIAGKIKKGTLREQSGFVLNDLQADVLYANNQAYLKDLLIKTPGTEIKRYALLTYHSYDDLVNNFPRTQIEADIENSRIQVKDILAFAPQLRNQPAFANPNAIWYLNLQGNGTIQSMRIRNLQFNGLKNTQIDASGSLATGNAPGRTGATLTIRRLHTTQTDIALFTGNRLSTQQVNLPEDINAHGTIAGSLNNLSANLTIATTQGIASVNGRFTDLTKPGGIATYTALVKTSSLNIGSILRNPQLGTLSADITVSGKGFTPETMDTRFKGSVYSFAYNNYVYRNITLDGILRQNTFTATTDINDPNLDLDGTITGNFSNNPSFRFEGMIDSIKTLPLHFTTEPLVIRGKVDADVPVINENYIEANVLITKALLVSNSDRLPLDTIHFVAGRTDTAQFMQLNSDVANARISGQYRYTDLGLIFQKSIEPYFSVTPGGTIASLQPYNFSFVADIENAPVLAAFVPGLESFDPVHIDGHAATGQGLTANLASSHINYNGNELNGLALHISSTDSAILLNADVQRLKGLGLDIYHTHLGATASNNKIDFNLAIDDQAARNKYYLAGTLNKASQNSYTLKLDPGSLLLNYEKWTLSPNNSLIITKDNIIADNFVLQHANEQLALQSEGENLDATFTNFQLSTITAFTKSDSLLVNGSMNGNVSFRNILRQPVFTSNLTINDLSLKGDTLGNAVIKVDNTAGDRYTTNATITGRGNDIALTGSFAPQGSKDISLDLELSIRQLRLASMQGALGNMIKNASGNVNGNITIKGTPSDLKINGPINFDKASFAISALGSQFRMDGEKITVTQNGFHFDNFIVRDTANNELRLNGLIQTPNFTNYFFDFDIDATNFQVLNSTKKDNKLYYGKLVITSKLHIDGSELRPIVDGNITVNEGTSLTVVMPQPEPGVVEREGIVEFVDMDAPENDSLFRSSDSVSLSQFTGMDITANIEIKKEAILNLVIDEANGDFLNVQGEGLLSTGIDPSGKITLVGTYAIEKGSYEITFNFLHRRFDIMKGSKIVWQNEPTKADLDVSAVYVANTAPIDLVESQITASTQAIRNTYLQKLPFEVHLFMTGELMEPTIRFDIVLPQDKNYGVSNDIITQVDNRLQQLRQEPGEIDKQVFALLLMNRFVGQNPLESSSPAFSAEAYARQSVSKLLTNQLNKLAQDLIDGVDLTFNVTSTDDYTTGERRARTDLNVGVSKRLLNDRLTVAVGSNYELEGPKNSNQKPSNFIGNVSVNYALSRDGRYMLRVYRKNEYEGIVDGYIIESGLSFIISVDYNRLSELFRKKKKQRVEGVSYPNK